MIQIRQLKLMPGHSDRELTEKAARVLRIRPEEIASLRVVRQSIDARKKPEIRLIYTVDVKFVGAREEKVLLSCRKNPDVGPAPEVRYRFPEPGKEILAERPLIIGTGPAGLFCGYLLARRDTDRYFWNGERTWRAVPGVWRSSGKQECSRRTPMCSSEREAQALFPTAS